MKKTEWIEEYKKDIENFDHSIISHYSDDNYDSMKDYEYSIMNHESDDIIDDTGTFKHFQD